MLETLGLIAGNILNLPGILGLALGMMSRSPLVGCILGALVGLASTYIFFSDLGVSTLLSPELVIAMIIGAIFGTLGSLIRRKGATV
ncbi:hypothetical protein [Tropicimonas marinistellae]|uniref:hypothetical protein n=1 Tax=Tropicimonas marinistellae TaxID=1739787 RepID=UPI00082BD45C|nr:hypothetical protein [Tropicimonas marinistellae]